MSSRGAIMRNDNSNPAYTGGEITILIRIWR
jgi:hypothetical protein